MTKTTAESIVDAYGWAIELCGDLEDGTSAKSKAEGLCDALRDFIILSLAEPREDA